MKTKTILALLLVVVMGFGKTNNLKETPACGCDSAAVKSSIIEGKEIEATITYASAKKGNPHYSDVYWITYGMNHYIVCNEAILPQKAKDLKHNEGQYLTVKCRGMLKELCHKQIHPAVVTYYHIELTKI